MHDAQADHGLAAGYTDLIYTEGPGGHTINYKLTMLVHAYLICITLYM